MRDLVARYDTHTNRVLWYVLVPITAVAMLFLSVQALGPAWHAFRREGAPGTFTADRQDCTSTSWHWYGTFVPDDRSAALTEVWLDAAPRGVRIGSPVRALDVGYGTKVIGTGSQVDIFLVPLFAVGSTAALVLWVYSIVRLVQKRNEEVPRSLLK